VVPTEPRAPVGVEVVVGTPGPGDEGNANYTCRLTVTQPGRPLSRRSVEHQCDAPWETGLRLTRVLPANGAGFDVVNPGAPFLLREWQWVGEGVVIDDRGAAAGVTPDGTGTKRTWRLELTFTPDPPK
jgi:hypothetical protein